MKRSLTATLIVLLSLFGNAWRRAPAQSHFRMAPVQRMRSLPFFVENAGQHVHRDVRYYVRGERMEIAFADGRVLFNTRHPREPYGSGNGNRAGPAPDGGVFFVQRLGDGMARPEAESPLSSTSHFFLGSDPSRWHTRVRHYNRILYRETYPGIDLVYSFDTNGNLVYEFFVKPGSDPLAIELTFEGILGVERRGPGGVDILTGNRERFHDGALLCYQTIDGERRSIPSSFRKLGPTSYGVRVRGSYDRSRTLVVDPTLAFSTYWGSGGSNSRTVAIDPAGNIYLSGGTSSVTWPTTPGAYQTTHSGTSWPDANVAKFDPDGNLVWSTFIGGPSEDYAYVSAVNAQGELYLSGRAGVGFPTTPGAFDRSFNGGIPNGTIHDPTDAWVVKLSAAGDELLYSTYIGGSGNDNGRAIHLLPTGELLVGGGNTTSTDLPVTAEALKSARGGAKDSWVARVSADGSSLVFCTYFGPSDDAGSRGDEIIRALGVDARSNVWIGGSTQGSDLAPTPDAFQPVRGSPHGTAENYIAKISPDGKNLVYFSWLGGNDFEEIETEGVSDPQGNFYVVGSTKSSDFPVTPCTFQSTLRGGWDAFAAKINDDGSLGFATLYGGTKAGPEAFFGPVVDRVGNVYCNGRFHSIDCPVTPDGAQPANAGMQDAALIVFSPDGKDMLYGSYFGGSGTDHGRHIGLHPDSSAVYLIAETNSTDVRLKNAYQDTPSGALLAKFDISVPEDPANRPPCIEAGPDQSTTLHGTVHLNGFVSDDGFPNPPGTLTTRWSKVSGPGAVVFGDTGSLATTATFSSAGIHVLSLAASDGDLEQNDELRVTVLAQETDPALVAHWKCDEGSGGITVDATGHRHDGTVHAPEWVQGKHGSALEFDGVNDHVRVPHASALEITGDLTITAWIWHDRNRGAQVIVSKGASFSTPCPYSVRVTGSGGLGFDHNDGSQGQDSIFSQSAIPLGSWHHVAIVRDATARTRSIYVDGFLDVGPDRYSRTPAAAGSQLLLGESFLPPGDAPFDGRIDDVRIYNRAFAAAEVAAIFKDVSEDAEFLRGDCNDDGNVDMSDAICTLNWLFLGEAASACVAVANSNGDDTVDISDAVYLLVYLFLGGAAPVSPFPDCGPGRLPADTGMCEVPPQRCGIPG